MENLNAEKVKKALEIHTGILDKACEECPYNRDAHDEICLDVLAVDTLTLITSQEQRIKELTAKVTKLEEECDLRGDMWCKLNEENKRLTEENEAISERYAIQVVTAIELDKQVQRLTEENKVWQKQLVSTEESADKAYYDLACEVENLRTENESLHTSCTELTQNLHECKADTVRKMQEQLKMEIDRFGRKDGFITKETVCWFINQIAKEILEEDQCQT